MAFYGDTLVFNGTSCQEFDLVVSDFGNTGQKTGNHTSAREAIEEQLARKYAPLYYGAKQNESLKFTIVMCLNEERAASGKPLARWEIENILRWLTGPDGYRYLEFSQPDMQDVRYKARVDDVSSVDLSWNTWAISVDFVCDSPFGYTYPDEVSITVSGTEDAVVYSRSTYTGIYYPVIEIEFTGSGRTVSISNTDIPMSSRSRTMSFTNVPSSVHKIMVDTNTRVITTDSGDNIYSYCNFGFLGLVPEDNHIHITGNCTVNFKTEYPVNIGG